jgi:NitT/TauT family transport system substrate-binding protein
MRRVAFQMGLVGSVVTILVVCSVSSIPAQAPVRLRVGIIPIVDLLQLFVADAKGYFAEEGLRVETTAMAGGAQIAPAVEGGSLDVGWSNVVSILLARERGFDFVFFAPGAFEVDPHNRVHQLLVPADSPVRGARDLVGKTVAVNTLANIPYLATLVWLDQQGVNPAQVRFVEIPFPDMPAALSGKRVDAAVVIEPFASVALAQGVARVLDPRPFAVFGRRVLVASWFAKRSWLDRNRQAASAFNRAIRRANEFILRRPAEARALIPRYTRVPADLAERMPLPGFFSTVFDSDVRPVVEAAVKHGLLRRPLTPEDILVRGLR